ETCLLERTVTTPYRWEKVPVDLAAWAGRKVTLTLSLASSDPASLGLWGSPVLREREPGGDDTATASGAAVPRAPQGIILVWMDTTRRDHLGMYGYQRDTTPVLTRLAKEGVRFDDCVSQATWTKVSTPSLVTSLYPTSHTVRQFSDRLPSSARTI